MLAAIADEIPTNGDHLLNHRVVRLTAAQARVLREHLESVVEGLEPADPRERQYGVLVGLYQRS